jgi:hypothetical protein
VKNGRTQIVVKIEAASKLEISTQDQNKGLQVECFELAFRRTVV